MPQLQGSSGPCGKQGWGVRRGHLMSNRMLAPLGTALNTLGCTCHVPAVATLSLDPASAPWHHQNHAASTLFSSFAYSSELADAYARIFTRDLQQRAGYISSSNRD